MGVLYLPGFSEYLPAEDAPRNKAMGSSEVANYLLTNAPDLWCQIQGVGDSSADCATP